ncbi:MAG: hypothetical protein M3Q42_11765 [Pseudomonadota bacterium]|nr:hypothetical protein [Pseudomonadota bacterium]
MRHASNPRLRSHEQAIDPAATGLSWWELYDNLTPGSSGMATRLRWSELNGRWTSDAAATRRTIHDRTAGPGGVGGQIVGCILLSGPRRWEIVVSRAVQWARNVSVLSSGSAGLATIYRRTSAGAWVTTAMSVNAYDVQMATGDTIVADAILSLEWEPFNPLATAAPFGQWLIRTASCDAKTW